jgi:hypothetical protein
LNMCNPDPVLAYFTPETLLPVGSIIATVLGVGMMLGRGSLQFLLRTCRRVFHSSSRIAAVSRPHFRFSRQDDAQAEATDAVGPPLETDAASQQ